MVDPKHPGYNPIYVKEVTGGDSPYVSVEAPDLPVEAPVQPVPETLPPAGKNVTRRLVVARYREDLGWLDRVPADIDIIVYNKGPTLEGVGHPVIHLPNVGRETTSILFHIVEHYDNLADLTFFSQGHPFDHSPDFIERLSLPYDRPTSLTKFYRADWPASWIKNLDKVEWHHGYEVRYGDARINEHGYGSPKRPWFNPAAWDAIFDCPLPEHVYFGYGASWCVPKSNILARPVEFYRHLLSVCDSGASGSTWTDPPYNPWSGEVLFGYIWSDPKQYPHKVHWDEKPKKKVRKTLLTPEQRVKAKPPKRCCGR